jgi:1,4-alpha-glucan branching enzyme
MGASLIAGGATFRVWAPGAEQVRVVLGDIDDYQPKPSPAPDELLRQPGSGHWAGFIADVTDGTRYRFFVTGPGGSGFKRDPWARELEPHGYPDCDCVVRDTQSFPWHDEEFRTPELDDLIVYQFHIGRFYAADDQGRDLRPHRVARLLDALDRVEYLADLGVTAVQPLPLVEFHGEWSLGYNGTDLFSPEMDYCVDVGDLAPYLEKVNTLLAKKGFPPLGAAHLEGQVNQLKAFVDIFHLYGIALIVDVVYNHAGGNLDTQSIDYFDFPAQRSPQNNLYFSAADWAGGRVFAFDRPEVRDFLIGNAFMFLKEYHVDGLRFDEVSVIDANGGWAFCQELTTAIRDQLPGVVLIAEYWAQSRWLAVQRPPVGMGFDIGYADALRDGVRGVLAQVAQGATAPVDLAGIRRGLDKPPQEPFSWQVYNCLENHDLVLDADGDHRKPRIARLADASNPRSWYARSRARVAAGLLLTAPGIPMMFMGQELLKEGTARKWPGANVEDVFRVPHVHGGPDRPDLRNITEDLANALDDMDQARADRAEAGEREDIADVLRDQAGEELPEVPDNVEALTREAEGYDVDAERLQEQAIPLQERGTSEYARTSERELAGVSSAAAKQARMDSAPGFGKPSKDALTASKMTPAAGRARTAAGQSKTRAQDLGR